MLIQEFSQRPRVGGHDLGRDLLRALIDAAHGDHFLRGGHPGTETLLLLAIKMHDYEAHAVPALAESKTSRSACLAGAAVAVQPLVLLAFPLLAAVVEPRRLAGYVARAAAPAGLLLAAAAAANWTATVQGCR